MKKKRYKGENKLNMDEKMLIIGIKVVEIMR